MLSRFVGSFKRSVSPVSPGQGHRNPNLDATGRAMSFSEENSGPDRNVYCRPNFLHLTPHEEKESINHHSRPIIVSSDRRRIPLGAGYAECINAGKSPRNEDEAAVATLFLPNHPNGVIGDTDLNRKADVIEVHYFGIFDGHAGPGAALMAADQLINHLQEKLAQIQADLFRLRTHESSSASISSRDSVQSSVITVDSLVRGALEAAFVAFDEHIARERCSFNITGGCAAIVALVMLDRVYVAHAGDCRAVAFIGNERIELATEFTPETDSERVQFLAHVSPERTKDMFSDNYFLEPLTKRDIGKRVLYRAPQRTGWHYKEVTEEDVAKPPLVAGRGKWARLMGVIGVTRGFGDHGLVIPGTRVHVKPFLTPVPEVRVLNLASKTITEDDILVIGCDGLWDMLSNEQVGSAAMAALDKAKEDKSVDRYTKAAEAVVHLARGDNEGKGWKMKDGQEGSFDDITAFVIPLHRCVNVSLKKSEHDAACLKPELKTE